MRLIVFQIGLLFFYKEQVHVFESKTTISEIREGRKVNFDNDNVKMVQGDIEINDCEAYGVAPPPATLTTSSTVDYEHVF